MKKLIIFLVVLNFTVNLSSQTTIKVKEAGGVYLLPCQVNGLDLTFILDTGASDVTISSTEASFMFKSGYLKKEDVIGTKNYQLANGDIQKGTVINLRNIKIGDINLYDVRASIIHNSKAPLLLGLSALKQLGKLQFDYSNNTLTILDSKKPIKKFKENNLVLNEDFNELKKRAEEGSTEAMFYIGLIYHKGERVPIDYEKAFYWYKKSAEQGSAVAMYNIGHMYYSGNGFTVDYKKALYWFEKSAEGAYFSALYNLALIYENGKDVPIDYEKAIFYYELNIKFQQFGLAYNNLGRLYEKGKGVKIDYEKAFDLFSRGAEQVENSDSCQLSLGNLYNDGKGVLIDKKKAFYWYNKSAEQGNAKAQYNLANMFFYGKGVLKDKKRAFYWYTKSAKQGIPVAQFNIGILYLFGDGVLMDKKQAAFWIKKSYENDYDKAKGVWEKFKLWEYE